MFTTAEVDTEFSEKGVCGIILRDIVHLPGYRGGGGGGGGGHEKIPHGKSFLFRKGAVRPPCPLVVLLPTWKFELNWLPYIYVSENNVLNKQIITGKKCY